MHTRMRGPPTTVEGDRSIPCLEVHDQYLLLCNKILDHAFRKPSSRHNASAKAHRTSNSANRRIEVMRAIRLLPLVLLVYAAAVDAQLPKPHPHVNPHLSRMPQRPLTPLVAPRAAPKVAANVIAVVCPPDAQVFGAAMCGNVYVPLDRKHRIPGTIPIYFELYTHSAPGPAESVILANFGEPGS